MKNWKRIARYSREIDVIVDLYLVKSETTKEQEIQALNLIAQNVKLDFEIDSIDLNGFAIINSQVNEAIKGTFAFGYPDVVREIIMTLPTDTMNCMEVSNFFHRLYEEVNADRKMSQEEKEEWADKFFSAL